MRFDVHDSYGYPVLRPDNDDYVDCTIQTNINAIADADLSVITVSYEVSLPVPELTQLISEKKVELLIYAECRETWFDLVHFPQGWGGSFSIPGNQIDGQLELTCIVVANENIASYRSQKFNSEYANTDFNIKRGEVLAFGNCHSFYITRDAFRNVTSLFDYSENTNVPMGEWDVSLDDDRIKVQVNPAQLPILRSAEGTDKNKAVLLSGIFLPILIQIVNEMNVNAEEYGELKWFKVIDQKKSLMPAGIVKNPVRLAQTLLKQPLSKLNTTMGWIEQ
jgi:hypothetical protein